MTINFIVNDPLAVDAVPMRTKDPLPDRQGGQAGLSLMPGPPAGLFPPESPDFVFWQSREAALTAIQTWESLNGLLSQWGPKTNNPAKLDLLWDAGDDLNAYYNRRSLSFFHHTTGTNTFYSGASTDVVAHESGHAFLDALRPELYNPSITEHAAFHEAFGDCTAILTALSDQDTRVALLALSPDLGSTNFVETLCEDLANATMAVLGPDWAGSEPRHALNNFKFQLPTTLPRSGSPAVLTSEFHSFGRIFSGCFYDMIRNMFQKAPVHDEAALLTVAQAAAKLLIAGVKNAEISPRFFQSVGRAIILADQTRENHQAISDAFSGHGILLGSMSALMANASLDGPAPRVRGTAKGLSLAPETVKDIRKRIAAPSGAKFMFQTMALGSDDVVHAIHNREVPLDAISKDLRGVVAYAPEPIVVGGVRQDAALFSALPDASTTEDEVTAFVETLLANDDISFASQKSGDTGQARNAESVENFTHIIEKSGSKRVLTRIRYY